MAAVSVKENWIEESEYNTERVDFSGGFHDNNSSTDTTSIEEIYLALEINDQKTSPNYQGTNSDQKNFEQEGDSFERANEINLYLSIQNTNEQENSTLKNSLLFIQELLEKKLEIKTLVEAIKV